MDHLKEELFKGIDKIGPFKKSYIKKLLKILDYLKEEVLKQTLDNFGPFKRRNILKTLDNVTPFKRRNITRKHLISFFLKIQPTEIMKIKKENTVNFFRTIKSI